MFRVLQEVLHEHELSSEKLDVSRIIFLPSVAFVPSSPRRITARKQAFTNDQSKKDAQEQHVSRQLEKNPTGTVLPVSEPLSEWVARQMYGEMWDDVHCQWVGDLWTACT